MWRGMDACMHPSARRAWGTRLLLLRRVGIHMLPKHSRNFTVDAVSGDVLFQENASCNYILKSRYP